MKEKKSKKVEEKTEEDFFKTEISMSEMLKKGVHFGHTKARRNPRMDKYIYTTKKGVNIIDLEKTSEQLKKALEFIAETVKNNKQILFVGTKKQAKEIVKLTAKKCEQPFVTERWLGGTLTNFGVIRKRAQYLKNSQEKLAEGEFDKYTKLEKLKKTEELEKLERKMGGLKEMLELPGAIFVIDAKDDNLAIEEAIKMNVPIISLVDTNVNPDKIDFPIPANDDAVSSIRLMLGYIGAVISNS